MCSQTDNSCAKAFDNRSRSKNLKPKKSRGGGVNLTCQFDPPPPPPRLLGLNLKCEMKVHSLLVPKLLKTEPNFLGPVARRVDNFIQRINPYPVDKISSLSNQN